MLANFTRFREQARSYSLENLMQPLQRKVYFVDLLDTFSGKLNGVVAILAAGGQRDIGKSGFVLSWDPSKDQALIVLPSNQVAPIRIERGDFWIPLSLLWI